MSGAQGLAAREVIAPARTVRVAGSRLSRAVGIGGGPSGLPLTIDLSPISTFGLFAGFALLPAFSSAPPAIQPRIVSRLSLARIGDLGGICGSALCATSKYNLLPSGSPGLITSPELPPAMRLVKLWTMRPP